MHNVSRNATPTELRPLNRGAPAQIVRFPVQVRATFLRIERKPVAA